MLNKIITILVILILLVIFNKQSNGLNGLNKVQIVNKLVRQAARWATASAQDLNPIIKLLHANYGAGYWWAVNDIATKDEIANLVGIDSFTFESEIIKSQEAATLEVITNCPKTAPKKTYLTAIAGEGI